MAQSAYKLKGCDRVDRLPRLSLTEVNQRNLFRVTPLGQRELHIFSRRVHVARLSDTYEYSRIRDAMREAR